MNTEHNFPAGTVLSTGAYTWTVKEGYSDSRGIPAVCREVPTCHTTLNLSAIDRIVSVPAASKPREDAYNLAVIQLAEKFGRSVAFGYRDASGKYSAPTVKVLEVHANSSRPYFGGESSAHDGHYRNYTVSRIRGEVELW